MRSSSRIRADDAARPGADRFGARRMSLSTVRRGWRNDVHPFACLNELVRVSTGSGATPPAVGRILAEMHG